MFLFLGAGFVVRWLACLGGLCLCATRNTCVRRGRGPKCLRLRELAGTRRNRARQRFLALYTRGHRGGIYSLMSRYVDNIHTYVGDSSDLRRLSHAPAAFARHDVPTTTAAIYTMPRRWVERVAAKNWRAFWCGPRAKIFWNHMVGLRKHSLIMHPSSCFIMLHVEEGRSGPAFSEHR